MSKEELKLKQAAEDIKDVLRKYDITGIVSLHTPGHGEHFMHLTASYSCAYIYDDNAVRFYAKKEDFKTDEEHKQKVTDTVNMCHILHHITGVNFTNLSRMTELLDAKFNAEHK